jgi:hypothetical protein
MDIIYYITINILLILIILSLLFLKFYRQILIYFDRLIDFLRGFIYKNDSFFTILFLIVFFTEQLVLIILAWYFRENIIFLQIIISIFALIVVTTSSFQKIILDVRVRYFKEQATVLMRLAYFSEKMVNKYKKLKK